MEGRKAAWDSLEPQTEGNTGFRFKPGAGVEVGPICLGLSIELPEQRRGYRESETLADIHKARKWYLDLK